MLTQISKLMKASEMIQLDLTWIPGPSGKRTEIWLLYTSKLSWSLFVLINWLKASIWPSKTFEYYRSHFIILVSHHVPIVMRKWFLIVSSASFLDIIRFDLNCTPVYFREPFRNFQQFTNQAFDLYKVCQSEGNFSSTRHLKTLKIISIQPKKSVCGRRRSHKEASATARKKQTFTAKLFLA